MSWYNIKIDGNKFEFFKYCTLLLIDDDNYSKIFIYEKGKYYIRGDNKSIHIKILNKFKNVRKSYEINVKDITDNCYKIDKPCIIKYCTILLIDDDNHSKIFISEKNMYYISYVGDDDDYDDCDELVYYNKPLNDFERLVSVRNNIVNLINNDNYKHNMTLLVDDFRIFICENDIY